MPLDLMASIQRGDLRGTNTYAPSILGTRGIVAAEGKALTDWDPRKFYSEDQIANFVLELIAGRRKWVEEIAKEGLKPEILAAAERSFAIGRGDPLGRPSCARTYTPSEG